MPVVAGHEDVRGADTEVGPSGGYLLDRLEDHLIRGNGGSDLNVQAGIPVVPLPEGGVIAGKLKLMVPPELKGHLFNGGRRSGLKKGQEDDKGGEEGKGAPAGGEKR
jgi:hypothetical protein